jgi:hypothetical protein
VAGKRRMMRNVDEDEKEENERAGLIERPVGDVR